MPKTIAVTSHVSRDFLQNAVYFNTLGKVVWEYVSNSLDNARDGVPATVVVEILKESDSVTIADNGMGMSRSDLVHFFTMHGENILRKKGKRVRGRFGTGKSAAFGIAKLLTLDTRKDGRRNVVSLHAEDIKRASSGQSFDVKDIVVEDATDLEDGTIVEIREFMTPRQDVEAVISYIEKHLARYHLKANVFINGHTCKFVEPPVKSAVALRPPIDLAEYIGSPELTIKVAPYALERDERGVDILSDGIWHETTLGDVDGRELSDRLFGEVDVPVLESAEDDIPPFDNTRNNQLNRANPRVVVLIAWISQELEKVRQVLVQEEKQRRRTEQAKKLAQEASRMADILNEDFRHLLIDLEASRRVSGRARSRAGDRPAVDGTILPGGGEEVSSWQESGQAHGEGHRGMNPPGEGELPRDGPSLIPGSALGSKKDASDHGDKRRSGLFSIEFVNLTAEYPRSQYKRTEHNILINLDHPQIALALKDGGGAQDSRHFLTMVYEVAAVEYAQAIPFERIQQGEQVDAPDALFAVGDAIDRVTRRFSAVLQQ